MCETVNICGVFHSFDFANGDGLWHRVVRADGSLSRSFGRDSCICSVCVDAIQSIGGKRCEKYESMLNVRRGWGEQRTWKDEFFGAEFYTGVNP